MYKSSSKAEINEILFIYPLTYSLTQSRYLHIVAAATFKKVIISISFFSAL